MAEHAADTRSIILSLVGFIAIFLLELGTFFLTNLLVFFAEALMGLGEILISTFLLLSIVWSQKPADELYMFGRRRAQNVAAVISAMIIILFMSLETFREAIPRLLQPTAEFQNVDLALIVIVTVTVIAAIPLVKILKTRARAASIKAQMVGLLIELGSNGASIIGIALVALGFLWADSLASLIVALSMIFSGFWLFRDNVGYLIGRAPSKEFLDNVESTARSVEGVLGVHDLKAEYVGQDTVHAGLHIEVARGTLIEDADKIAGDVQTRVSQKTGCQHCVVHVDPLNPLLTKSESKHVQVGRV